MIPYGRQDINQADIDAVIDVLKSDYLTQGVAIPLFEETIAEYCQSKYAVAVNSATSALHIACLALGLGKGDWLWTTPITFVSSANCGLYCGAQIDFVDINPDTYNMSSEALEQKLIQSKRRNKIPKIVVPVHFAGQSCDMKRIYKLGQEYGFKIIEDASHAIGGRYLNQTIGCCAYSDVTVFSFHPVKIITTGEGGVATTVDVELADAMRRLRSHGITRDPAKMLVQKKGGWYYEQIQLGFNYRMTEMQAALGVSQMSRLNEFIKNRQALNCRYGDLLTDLPIRLPTLSDNCYSALHLYPIQIDLKRISKTRTQVFQELINLGIGVNVHYIPVHTQPYYREVGFKMGDFPRSEHYYNHAISIPLYQGLSFERQDYVVEALNKVLT